MEFLAGVSLSAVYSERHQDRCSSQHGISEICEREGRELTRRHGRKLYEKERKRNNFFSCITITSRSQHAVHLWLMHSLSGGLGGKSYLKRTWPLSPQPATYFFIPFFFLLLVSVSVLGGGLLAMQHIRAGGGG
jgi:hypothetical protein